MDRMNEFNIFHILEIISWDILQSFINSSPFILFFHKISASSRGNLSNYLFFDRLSLIVSRIWSFEILFASKGKVLPSILLNEKSKLSVFINGLSSKAYKKILNAFESTWFPWYPNSNFRISFIVLMTFPIYVSIFFSNLVYDRCKTNCSKLRCFYTTFLSTSYYN